MGPYRPNMTPKWTHTGPKMGPRWAQDRSNMDLIWGHIMGPSWSRSGTIHGPPWAKCGPMHSPISGPILGPWWGHVTFSGAHLGPNMGPRSRCTQGPLTKCPTYPPPRPDPAEMSSLSFFELYIYIYIYIYSSLPLAKRVSFLDPAARGLFPLGGAAPPQTQKPILQRSLATIFRKILRDGICSPFPHHSFLHGLPRKGWTASVAPHGA
jgi:hypothetical protein